MRGDDFELSDEPEASPSDSRSGFIGPQPELRGSAPVADITARRYLYRERVNGVEKHTVMREPDGSLRVSERWGSYVLPAPLARWMEQDNTVLTWRQLPTAQGTELELCLIDADQNLLWRRSSATTTTTPPPAVPHDPGGPALALGARLRLQSLTSASGSHTLLHHHDGDLVLYCNATHAPVWATGTSWIGDSWVDLTPHGDLVLRTSCGAPVWRSDTAGAGVVQLVVGDDGTLALLDAAGAAAWRIDQHTGCAKSGHTPPRGATLRRGQMLRNQSLTSADGGTVLRHEPSHGLRLFRADGIEVWYEPQSRADNAYVTLDLDGRLQIQDDAGTVLRELAGPADHLIVVPGGEIRAYDRNGAVVWREGHRVIDAGDEILTRAPRPVTPRALEALLNTLATPIVRTSFTDGDAWNATWADITRAHEYYGEELTLYASLVDLPEFDGWTDTELASVLAHGNHALALIADDITITSAEHPVLVVEIEPRRRRPRTFRATPHALIGVTNNLTESNMDWEEFSDHADPDGIFRG